MPNNRSPKINVTELRQDRISFELSDTDASMANALRRIMISEVPTLTIDMVTFEENTSCLADEFIAHRLGLLPLRSLGKDMSLWNYNHNCDCGQLMCGNCSVTFSLDCSFDSLAERRINTMELTELRVNVTSRDLESSNPDVVCKHFSNDEEEEVSTDDGITILQLGKGQKIKLTAIARKGIGKEHSKWSPVSTIALKYDPVVKLNDDVINEYEEEKKKGIVVVCPTGVFELDEATKQLHVTNPTNCIFCKECIFLAEDYRKFPEDPLAVNVEHSADRFYFTVETTGALEPQEVVRDGLRKLGEKVKRLKINTMKILQG